EDLASVGARHPFHVLSLFVAHGPHLASWSAGAPVQADKRAALGVSGPQTTFGQPGADNAVLLRELAETATPRRAAIEQARRDATPALRLERGWMLLTADAYRPAYDDFAGALEDNPTDARALEGLIRASAPLNRTADA